MINGYDITYALGVGLSAPYWLIKPSARQKVLRALNQRMGKVTGRDPSRAAVMIHAVSLGEINATRALVTLLHQARPDLHFIISTTTETGYARGQELYGPSPQVTLIRYPLDFSGAVARVLDLLRPDVVVLMELELWPNFIGGCVRRKIPVILANGRLTSSSFCHYRLIKPVASAMLKRLAAICVQDSAYANRFAQLGAPLDKIKVLGTMKFDTAQVADHIPGADEVAASVGLHPGDEPIWVCGSTGPGEEQIILHEYRTLLAKHSRLRLVLVPRRPERFDEVSQLIKQAHFKVIRRSRPKVPDHRPPVPPVVLGDTMGELRKFFSLADIVFVGRSLVDLGPRQHGSDMIEPAALGKPVIVGPFTANFAEAMNQFKAADAMLEVNNADALRQAVSRFIQTPRDAVAMGRRAQSVVRREQGSTLRHVQVILEHLPAKPPPAPSSPPVELATKT